MRCVATSPSSLMASPPCTLVCPKLGFRLPVKHTTKEDLCSPNQKHCPSSESFCLKRDMNTYSPNSSLVTRSVWEISFTSVIWKGCLGSSLSLRYNQTHLEHTGCKATMTCRWTLVWTCMGQ